MLKSIYYNVADSATLTGEIQMDTLQERFFENVAITDDESECWLWEGAQRGGSEKLGRYGQVCHNSKIYYAHRVAWSIYNESEVPEGMHVLHANTCKSRLCCNPKHLRIGTHLTNMRQKKVDGTQNMGQTHGLSKLTNIKVKKIRELHATGEWKQYELAKKFRITAGHVSNIVQRKVWKHI